MTPLTVVRTNYKMIIPWRILHEFRGRALNTRSRNIQVRDAALEKRAKREGKVRQGEKGEALIKLVEGIPERVYCARTYELRDGGLERSRGSRREGDEDD